MYTLEKMKAAILYGPRDLRVELIEKPTLKPGWVLLEVGASGICGSDLHLFREKTSIPISSVLGEGIYIPGHELAGVVSETGKGVTSVSVGDRVGVEPEINCGKCKWCKAGWYNLCSSSQLIGFYYIGGLAEYCVVPAEKCLKLPDSVSYAEAATLDCIAVAEHAVKRARVSTEDSVAILGAGTIGLFTLQAALLAGARDVYVTGTHQFQLDTAKKLGASQTIDARSENVIEQILEITDGAGVDKVIEAVGGESPIINEAVEMTRRRGRVVMTGIYLNRIPLDLFSLLTKEVTLTSAWGYEYWSYIKEIALSLDLLENKRIDAKSLITHRFPIEKAEEAFITALDKKESNSIKVQIEF